jgi:hypothetical protein
MTRELTALFVLLVFVQILDYSLELPFDLMVYFDNRVSSQTKLVAHGTRVCTNYHTTIVI